MKVFVAETGRNFDIQFGPLDDVDGLTQQLAPKTGITTRDQILICSNGTKLDKHYTLKSYGLDDKEVFLFNRQSLRGEPSKPLKFLDPNVLDFVVPESPPTPRNANHPLATHKTIMLRNFPDFEHTFKFHCDQAKIYHEGGSTRVKACEISFNEQRVQTNALEAVICNLNTHSKHLSVSFGKFFATFGEQDVKHRRLLDTFETKLADLRRYELHPALRTSSRATLLDCVKEGALRQFAKDCRQHHEQLKQKIFELRKVSKSLEDKVQTENTRDTPFEFEFLNEHYKKATDILGDQLRARETLVRDYNDVAETIHKIIEGRDAIDPHECLKEFELKNEEHGEINRKLKTLDEKLRITVEIFGNSQQELSRSFYLVLKNVSKLQSQMRDLENKIALFSEAISAKEQMFERLSEIENTPAAYEAALAEISRRRAYGRQFLGEASAIAGRLSHWRDEEAARRESFVTKYGRSIPSILGKSLEDRPAYCDIHTREFDTSLPEIDSYTLEDGTVHASEFHLSDDEDDAKSVEDDLPELEKGSLILPAPHGENGSGFLSGYDKSSHTLKSLQNENEYLQAELALHKVSCSLIPKTAYERKTESDDKIQEEITKMREELTKSHCHDLTQHHQKLEESKILYESQLNELQKEVDALNDDRTALKKENQSLSVSTDNLLAEKEAQEREKQKIKLILEKEKQKGDWNEKETARIRAEFEVIKTKEHRKLLGERKKFEEQWQAKLEAEKARTEALQKQINDLQNNRTNLSKEKEVHALRWEEECARNEKLTRQLETLTLECEQFKKYQNEEKHSTTELQNKQKELKNLHYELDRMAMSSAVILKENNTFKETVDKLSHLVQCKISYESFESDDIVLFYKNDKNHYIAFSTNLQNRFLSQESRISIFQHREDSSRPFILGRIVYIGSEQAASSENAGNPFDLEIGTEYWELVVEYIK